MSAQQKYRNSAAGGSDGGLQERSPDSDNNNNMGEGEEEDMEQELNEEESKFLIFLNK